MVSMCVKCSTNGQMSVGLGRAGGSGAGASRISLIANVGAVARCGAPSRSSTSVGGTQGGHPDDHEQGPGIGVRGLTAEEHSEALADGPVDPVVTACSFGVTFFSGAALMERRSQLNTKFLFRNGRATPVNVEASCASGRGAGHPSGDDGGAEGRNGERRPK